MALAACFHHSQFPLKSYHFEMAIRPQHALRVNQMPIVSLNGMNTEKIARPPSLMLSYWSFKGGSKIAIRPKVATVPISGNQTGIHASWLAGSHLASSAFTFGTIAVMPFYSIMVFAPKAKLTKKCMESSFPFFVLSLLYAYLLYLSWTPETLRYMFASKYWLPELPGMVKMFSSEMTVASAWLHLLTVDLFAARQVYRDGLENEIETRHSVSLCLLFCPIGLLTHAITKALTESTRKSEYKTH